MGVLPMKRDALVLPVEPAFFGQPESELLAVLVLPEDKNNHLP